MTTLGLSIIGRLGRKGRRGLGLVDNVEAILRNAQAGQAQFGCNFFGPRIIIALLIGAGVGAVFAALFGLNLHSLFR